MKRPLARMSEVLRRRARSPDETPSIATTVVAAVNARRADLTTNISVTPSSERFDAAMTSRHNGSNTRASAPTRARWTIVTVRRRAVCAGAWFAVASASASTPGDPVRSSQPVGIDTCCHLDRRLHDVRLHRRGHHPAANALGRQREHRDHVSVQLGDRCPAGIAAPQLRRLALTLRHRRAHELVVAEVHAAVTALVQWGVWR